MDRSTPSVAEIISDASGALVPHSRELSEYIYDLIVREIPQLRGDRRILALLEASVEENVATLLHVFQNGIDLETVHAPAAAEAYARRLAQRGVDVVALLRAYRIGSARFQDACLQELGQRTDNAATINAAVLSLAEITASYIDKVSEEVVSAYESEKENWLRNLSAARAARVRALLAGEPVDPDSSEAVLGYRLRQRHVGVVCWVGEAEARGADLARLEHTAQEVAEKYAGRPLFLPQDESSAWAWLPMGARDALDLAAAHAAIAKAGGGVRFAVGAAASGVSGFRRTHQRALGAQAVALAAGPSGPLLTSFTDVAPLALMSGSIDLVRGWVRDTLGSLANDDIQSDRLRDTLRVFLEAKGSFKVTAERLTLHKNTVHYRVRKAEESIGRPIDEDRLNIELALLAIHWLGSAVLQGRS